MRSSRIIGPFIRLTLLPVVLAGCSGDAADRAATAERAEQASRAAVIDVAFFDSISWPSPSDALHRGATVYAYSCAKCHGDRGAGDGGYVLRGRLLRPPSFRVLDWRFADDMDGLRQAIYSGNDRGMPHWGSAGLPARDVDAVARYIVNGLRADLY